MAKKEIESGINYDIYIALHRKGFFYRKNYVKVQSIVEEYVLKITDDIDDLTDYIFLLCQRDLRLNFKTWN